MTSPYDRLGISPTATPAEVKAAYHARLKEFPAHSHPTEFKEIRAAYDAVRQGKADAAQDSFLQPRPIEATLDSALLEKIRARVNAQIEVTLDELIRLSF